MIQRRRTAIAALVLSAAGLVTTVLHEDYSSKAIIPVRGDRPTLGFGTTAGVHMGDTITPPRALARSLSDIQKYEGAIKQCVKVPLYQYEYDAYVDLAYNIGPSAFCSSTLVRTLNRGDYSAACHEILRWDKFQGHTLRGLAIRRQQEYHQCMGETK